MTSGSEFPFSPDPVLSGTSDDRQHALQLNPQQLLDRIPVTIWQANDQGQIISLSARWQLITGRAPVDSLGEEFWNSVLLEDRDLSLQQWINACQQQRPFVLHLHLCSIRGNSCPFLIQSEPLLNDTDQLIGWVGTLQSTDVVIPLQSKWDYTQKFLQALLDNLSNGIVACDTQGVLTLFNSSAKKLHGLPLCPIPADEWASYYHLYQADGTTPLPQAEIPLYRALQGESVHNAEIVVKPSQGKPRTILASGDPIIAQDGQKLGAVVAIQDITLRKQAELELRKSEERWQLALQGTGDGLFDWNIVTNEVFMSPQLKQTLGYADHEVDNNFEGWRQLVHPDDLGEVAAAIEAHLRQSMPLYVAEYRMRCKDGSYKWNLARGQTKWDDNGQPIRMIGSHQDITRRKQAEMELARLNRDLEARVTSRTTQLEVAKNQKEALVVKEQEARRQSEVDRAGIKLYESIISNIQLGILVWHSQNLESVDHLELVSTNPAAESILKMNLHVEIGRQMSDIFPSFVGKHPDILLSLVEIIRTQQPRSIENVPYTFPEGDENLFSLRAFPLPEDCVGVAFENVTCKETNEPAFS
ncbi:PAS domain S-box protein [Acaryochloris marina NIES-2412]|uniref:PAS domain S-box protein n=1 Tax=Acaryochloris marina TaxID=155978 RepID=UPI004059613F